MMEEGERRAEEARLEAARQEAHERAEQGLEAKKAQRAMLRERGELL